MCKQELMDRNITSIPADVFSNRESFQELFDISKMFAASSLIPANYQGKPQDCMIAVDMSNRLGVSPMMVMQNLYVVKGKPAWSGQACMALIKACKDLQDVHPVYTGEKGTDSRGCYVEATKRSTGEIIQGTEVTMAMARAEGWLSNSKWRNMPEQMLAYRAAAFFARVYCPERLMGVQTDAEVLDIMGENSKAAVVDPFKSEETE